MLTIDSPGLPASAGLYRFAGVEIDALRMQLRVDGRPVACPRKAFELLVLLCRAPRTVLPRAWLIDTLWPGGQVISDDALTQTIFRARAALGPYAASIATVRGVGLRLDAAVSIPAAPEQDSAVAVPAPLVRDESPSSRQVFRWALFSLAVLLAGLAVVFWPWSGAPVILDRGYGLYSDAIIGEQPETATLVREAFESEAIGERARGINLLEAVHRNDARTPIPALFLALWSNGSGHAEIARGWLEQARARIANRTDLYLNLLLDYITAEVEGTPRDIIHAAGAVLDLRPDAWRMRHARAHLMEYIGMREAALREISQIHVDGLVNRKLALVIADRASMGDVEGAQAILDRIPGSTEPTTHAFLNGRVAWSRGDFTAAHAQFLRAAESSHALARLDIFRQALFYAGAIETMWGRDDQALLTLERARAAAMGQSRIDEIDLCLFIAQLHLLAGRRAQAFAELDRALELTPEAVTGGVAFHAQLAALRMRPDAQWPRPGILPPDLEALWRAAEAVARRDRDLAQERLSEAQNLGIHDSRFADEARWLELALGLPVSAENVIDPPYPPLSRVVLRREIRQELAARGAETGPQRP